MAHYPQAHRLPTLPSGRSRTEEERTTAAEAAEAVGRIGIAAAPGGGTMTSEVAAMLGAAPKTAATVGAIEMTATATGTQRQTRG